MRARRQLSRQRALADHDRHRGVFQHETDPVLGIAWIQRHIRCARFQRAQQRGQHLWRAVEKQPDHGAFATAVLAQPCGNPVRLCIEFGIAQPCPALYDRNRVRGALCLGFEHRVDGRLRGQRPRGLVQRHQQVMALFRRHQLKLAQTSCWGGHRCAHQVFKMAGEALHVFGVEQIGRVLDHHQQAAVALAGENRNVGARGARMGIVHLHRQQGQPGQFDLLFWEILVEHHGLEQRRVAEAALDVQCFDQALDRHILVRIAVDGQRFDLRKQFAEGRICRHVHAQRKRVDEKPDQQLDLAARTVGVAHADHDVVLAGIARQHRVENRKKGHERGRAFLPAEAFDFVVQRRRNHVAQHCTAIALHRRPRAVAGKFQHRRRRRETLLPVFKLRGCRVALGFFKLPQRVIGVLDGQFRQGRCLALKIRSVELGQFAIDDAERPAIDGDVVRAEQQQGFVGRDPDQGGADDRPVGKVEGRARIRSRERDRGVFACVLRQCGNIVLDQRHRCDRQNMLLRPDIVLHEHRTQAFVAAHDLGQRALQGVDIQHTAEPHQ